MGHNVPFASKTNTVLDLPHTVGRIDARSPLTVGTSGTSKTPNRTITPEGERLDGVGITYIQCRFGFKSTKKAWDWLESIGYGKDSGKWKPELSAVESHKLSPEFLNELDRLADEGSRQRWLGE